MNLAHDPRLAFPEQTEAAAQTWRVLLSLPGRVAMVDPRGTTELMRMARAVAGEVVD